MKPHFLLISIFSLLAIAASSQRSDVQGGQAHLDFSTYCVSAEQHDEIMQRLNENIRQLNQDGILPLIPSHRSEVLFDFPMQWSEGFDDYGFYGIANFVDQDPTYPGNLLDFNCGMRTYDTKSGYNHAGIDFFLWPFQWNLVEANAVSAVAAARGMIIGKDDGHEHTSCGFSSADWNAVYLMHEDGSTSWYGHLKKNSLTIKLVGEYVETGEYLGIIASSGNSTAPHLHFEVYDNQAHLIDPNFGECNALNPTSWWADQRPYFDPKINKIQTHFAPPVFSACPEPDIINDADDFDAGELIYFVTYFSDQRNTDLCIFSIIQPNEVVFDVWTFLQPQSYFAASYWYWSYVIPSDAMEGTWTFQCLFKGKTYTHLFEIHNGTSAISDEASDLCTSRIVVDEENTRLLVDCSKPLTGEVQLSDINGRLLDRIPVQFTEGEHEVMIPTEGYSPGMYFLTLIDKSLSPALIDKIIVH